MDAHKPLPVLDEIELRVLGSLMEKAKTTPDYYPMTINALTAACNQKTSRRPVVQYDEETVVAALNSLKRKGLVSTATGGTSRVVKYKHNFALVYPVTQEEVAVMCLLFLRSYQTPGEINTNSGRMYEFIDLDEVQTVLDKLAAMEPPFVVQLPRRPGQKEARYTHLFGGSLDVTKYDTPEETHGYNPGNYEARLEKLEQDYAALKEAFDKLMKDLNG
jgi:uncharacterized protein YceH (UPF0502 family)